MKINRRGYGPRPSWGRALRPLSESRAALLDILRAQIEPTTLTALVNLSGLHPNTVREHLTALVQQGLAQREPMEVTGRGRPAWLYEATGPEAAASPEYAGLAAALASAISRTTTKPWEPAVAAGEEWGRRLISQRPLAEKSGEHAARQAVVDLLDDMRFSPEPDDELKLVRLTRCPLLEAAHRHTEAVCGVHLGIARAALEEYGVDPSDAELIPFAERGACVLHLMRQADDVTE